MTLLALRNTAKVLVAPGKGILAADESTATITKRFDAVGVESTAESRREWRELLVTAAGAGESISGVILYDETIRQRTSDGASFAEALERQGIKTGIKVDTGAHALAGCPGEKVTEGLDGLRERLHAYHAFGARFAKWRAVIAVDEERPTSACLQANAHVLARYAALSQEAGLVPIVEPEVLMDGAHTIERCAAVTEATLGHVFEQLRAQHVDLEATLLKANMVLAGTECRHQPTIAAVAEATVRTLRNVVPPAVPGILFLSGGQDPQTATTHLHAINLRGTPPWELSFSFGRALQAPALALWRGQEANFAAAQAAFLDRARANAAARAGEHEELAA
jgi:fructose-bisphosphate aldolase class I